MPLQARTINCSFITKYVYFFFAHPITRYGVTNKTTLTETVCLRGWLSPRWRKNYIPDLSRFTQKSEDDETLCTCHIVDGFLRSQHRLVLQIYGICIPLTTSLQKITLKLSMSELWGLFADDLDQVVFKIYSCVVVLIHASNSLKAAAKRVFPRGFRREYILSVDQDCVELYKDYNSTHIQFYF
jgi:hypothetical protein